MAQHVCEQCGAPNTPAAQFCQACDAYLGWDKGATTIGGLPFTGTVPRMVEAVTTEVSLPPLRAAGGPAGATGPAVATVAGSTGPAGAGEAPVTAGPGVVEAPRARLTTTEVTLDGAAPVTAAIELFNASSVVDGFVVEPTEAPGWLVVGHEPVRLMPGQEGTLELTLQMRGDVLVFAQRFPLRLVVSSEADPAQRTQVRLAVTVPAVGPPATLDVEPRLLRLTDSSRAKFSVLVDNRAANFPQTFHLAGSDPEGVVQFGFLPSVVQAPAGQVVEVRGHFVAPPPPAGREATRQLSITGSNDEGQVSTVLTVVQLTSPEPEDAPVAVRLSPGQLRVTNTDTADFEVHVDNRAGHRDATLSLDGRDPARLMTFSLVPQRVLAPAGQVTVVRGRLRTAPVPRGQTVTRTFTVVATDGVTDVEAPGVLEVTTTPAPLTTAELAVTPRSLTRADDRRGTFAVAVDNRRGREPLPVWLSGADEHGMARFTFEPASFTVPAGGVTRSRMTVDCPRPPSGETVARELEVVASDGEGRLAAAATFTQVSSDRRPLLRTLLVLCGALLVVLGAMLPWFLPFDEDGLTLVRAATQITDITTGEMLAAAAGVRVLLGLAALLMVFGLTGQAGSLTRKSAILAVLLSVGYVVAAVSLGQEFRLSAGLAAVWLGAVLAYVGGVLARQR